MATDIPPPDCDPADPALTAAMGALSDSGPDRDLWPDIAPRLTPRAPPAMLRRRWPIALAASLMLVAGASLAVPRFFHRGPDDSPEQLPPSIGTMATPSGATDPGMLVLEAAIVELGSAADVALPRLDPPTRTALAASLEALDGAIADAARQVQAAPEDPRAEQYLAATLDRKRDVLRIIVMAAARQEPG